MGTLEVLTTGVGGGVLAAIVTFLARNIPEWWRQRGEQAVAKAEAAAKRQELTFTLMEKATDRLDKDVKRLSETVAGQQSQITEQASQIGELQEMNAGLAEENRSFRRVILSVMDMLRRRPPETPETILAFILEHLPHIGKGRD